mmetsp:Transcript_105844/g.252471  ORF Transcript_105844/g.252471 Transcript_105844/m.252471 type:complete len:263 (-) Transcript_105844:1012-1800(-)
MLDAERFNAIDEVKVSDLPPVAGIHIQMEVCGPAEPITFLPADDGGGKALPIGANSGDFFLPLVHSEEVAPSTEKLCSLQATLELGPILAVYNDVHVLGPRQDIVFAQRAQQSSVGDEVWNALLVEPSGNIGQHQEHVVATAPVRSLQRPLRGAGARRIAVALGCPARHGLYCGKHAELLLQALRGVFLWPGLASKHLIRATETVITSVVSTVAVAVAIGIPGFPTEAVGIVLRLSRGQSQQNFKLVPALSSLRKAQGVPQP